MDNAFFSPDLAGNSNKYLVSLDGRASCFVLLHLQNPETKKEAHVALNGYQVCNHAGRDVAHNLL